MCRSDEILHTGEEKKRKRSIKGIKAKERKVGVSTSGSAYE